MIVESNENEEEQKYTPGKFGSAKDGSETLRGGSDTDIMFEEPIGLAPALTEFDSGGPKSIEAVTEHTRREEARTNAQSTGGLLSSYCPNEFPGKIKPLTFTLLVFMSIFILFTFCAMCVSGNKLSSGSITILGTSVKVTCGHSKFCMGSNCVKYTDDGLEGSDDAKAMKRGGNVFVTFAVFSWFLEIVMLVIVLDWDLKFLKDRIPYNTRTIHLIMNGVLWLMLTISWGAWADHRRAPCSDVGLGDATNLLITVWFFLHFYIALSIEYVQKLLFGEQAYE